MPTLPTEAREAGADRAAALAELRRGANPFATAVASAGTAADNVRSNVPAVSGSQLADLLQIVRLYRTAGTATRIYAVLGDPGTGKTHLLHVLRDRLRERAGLAGEESMVVVVDRLSPGTDPLDYLLWQLANHLLAGKGDGERLLQAVAGRLTGRLLAEALRGLAPHHQAALIPPAGPWERLRLGFGSPARVRRRLDAVAGLIDRADRAGPLPDDLRHWCAEAGVPAAAALRVVEGHLDRTEPRNPAGWLRRALYARLGRLALFGDRGPFEDFQNGEYEQAPGPAAGGGNVGRCLLETWLDLLAAVGVPVVCVFDQLEDYLRTPTADQDASNRRWFSQAVTTFVNTVPGVCVLVFAEEGVWTDLLNAADPYTVGRLAQPFALDGRPSQTYIRMPARVEPPVLQELVQARVRAGFPTLDLTGLPPPFPFDPADLSRLGRETSVRDCLRKLARRYDEIVYQEQPPDTGPTAIPPPDEGAAERRAGRLLALWNEQTAAARAEYGTDLRFSTTFIPEVQTALRGWLQCLADEGLVGWAKADLVTEKDRRQFGYLTVARIDGSDAPGVGVAFWLGERAPKLTDVQRRLEFFADNPCPVRTLVLLRADGPAALTGASGLAVQAARGAGRDVRVEKYGPSFFYPLMAFAGWHQAALAEIREGDDRTVFRSFLAEVSRSLLAWVDRWRQPAARKGD